MMVKTAANCMGSSKPDNREGRDHMSNVMGIAQGTMCGEVIIWGMRERD